MNAPKPEWLRVGMPSGQAYFDLLRLLKQKNLRTVCQEANCPNIAECFGKRTVTFMILGDTCTRDCKYCNVTHGIPKPLDPGEAARIARAVKELGLKYTVITSVTRDDLPDGGASLFAKTIYEIRIIDPECKIEVLIPDFMGSSEALQTVLDFHPDVLNHNIEVVKRLFPVARPQGDYKRSMKLLKEAKERSVRHNSIPVTKSGFMVGLGESKEEIIETMRDLDGFVDILTIGQYLQPSKEHLPVVRYYTPEEFKELKEIGLSMGFKHVEAGPLVRSSYHAGEYSNREDGI